MFKSGKTPGMDRFPVECLNKGGMVVFDWLVLLNVSIGMGVVPKRYKGNVIHLDCTYGLAWYMSRAPVQR